MDRGRTTVMFSFRLVQALALWLQSWRLEKGAPRKENQNDTAARRQQRLIKPQPWD